MITTDVLLKTLYASIGTLGFAVGNNIKGWRLIVSALGGALAWFSYLMILHFSKSMLFSVFFSALLVSIYSEVIAKLRKVPVTSFVICGIIPLVPGSGMYYSMLKYTQGKINAAMQQMLDVFMIAVAIAAAMALVSSITALFQEVKRHF